ncbi:gamma-glutamylcyclotransferase family protein [Terrarubrum flagellatum]|uniref:gamma-glutamylcyclotransferase family protein n=1 Tax=Terrirubrum flagellatum TaxID=2895980 RepID=UPI003144ED3D
MPLYFAYGANMDVDAMARRCPASKALGVARLARHRLFITADGYASVQRSLRDAVIGIAWDLALADVRALDRFEGLDRGLYRKIFAPVILTRGRSARAMIYIGSSSAQGAPLPGYVEAIIAAAESWKLPPPYLASIAALRSQEPARAGVFKNA